MMGDQKYICERKLMTIYECKFVHIHVATHIFIIEIVSFFFDFKEKKLVYMEFLEYVMNACGS